MGAHKDIATAALESVTRILGMNVTYCQMNFPGDSKTAAQRAEEARLWQLLLGAAGNGLFELLDMGVDIRELIEARLLAAIAEMDAPPAAVITSGYDTFGTGVIGAYTTRAGAYEALGTHYADGGRRRRPVPPSMYDVETEACLAEISAAKTIDVIEAGGTES